MLLGDKAEPLARRLSEDWSKTMATPWANRHRQASAVSSELARLDQPGDAPPDAATLWKKAQALIDLQGDAAAAPVVDQVLALAPRHPYACFVRGRQLLAQDDPRGIEFVEIALAGDLTLTQPGLELLYKHYTRTGQRERLRELENRSDQFRQVSVLAQQERSRITHDDTFSPSGLSEDQIAPLRALFANEPDVSAVAVARRNLRYLPTSPGYVVCVKMGVSWWKPRSVASNREIIQRLVKQIKLPAHFLVFVAEKQLEGPGEDVFAVPSAVIYQRAAKAA
jgi:hypothetical protein